LHEGSSARRGRVEREQRDFSGLRVLHCVGAEGRSQEHGSSSLRRLKVRQAAEKPACGRGYLDTDLVFTQADGSQVHPQTLTETFARRVKSAGLPMIRLHDLRRTHVAHLLAAGANVKIVSKRMGHASSSFTLDRYGHLIDGEQASAAAAVADLVDSAG
jgi:integrase